MISSFPLLIREKKNLEFLLFINQKELFKGTVSRDFRPFLVKKTHYSTPHEQFTVNKFCELFRFGKVMMTMPY